MTDNPPSTCLIIKRILVWKGTLLSIVEANFTLDFYSTIHLCILFDRCTVVFFKLAHNGKHLCRAGLVALQFPHVQKLIESTKVKFCTSASLATNTMLCTRFFYSSPSTFNVNKRKSLNLLSSLNSIIPISCNASRKSS